MKYIKLFEAHSHYKKRCDELEIIKKECDDILLPLIDDGINIVILYDIPEIRDWLRIMNEKFSIYIDSKTVKYDRTDFKKYIDDLYHLNSYLNECGFYITKYTLFQSWLKSSSYTNDDITFDKMLELLESNLYLGINMELTKHNSGHINT